MHLRDRMMDPYIVKVARMQRDTAITCVKSEWLSPTGYSIQQNHGVDELTSIHNKKSTY
jgi:hypothetical protein